VKVRELCIHGDLRVSVHVYVGVYVCVRESLCCECLGCASIGIYEWVCVRCVCVRVCVCERERGRERERETLCVRVLELRVQCDLRGGVFLCVRVCVCESVYL